MAMRVVQIRQKLVRCASQSRGPVVIKIGRGLCASPARLGIMPAALDFPANLIRLINGALVKT